MEADQRHHFGDADTVIVCWTNVMREDRYTDRWQTLGNITTCPIYNPGYVQDAITERGCLIRDVALIKATASFLNSCAGVTTKFLSMCDIMNPQQFDYSSGDQDIFDLYKPILNNIMPSYQTVLYPTGWKHSDDPHPTPAEHLAYLDAVLPGWVTKAETRVKIAHETANLQKNRTGMSTVTRL
jgi:hypothetical protein